MENKINEAKKETYDFIKKQIENQQIKAPIMSVKELKTWLSAYATCQNNTLDLLEQLEVYEVQK